jgi:hypothetical protein
MQNFNIHSRPALKITNPPLLQKTVTTIQQNVVFNQNIAFASSLDLIR